MTNDFADEVPELRFEETASRALLGLLCEPGDVHGGEWWLLVEDENSNPISFVPVALRVVTPQAPLQLVEEALSRAGYEHRHFVTPQPWTAGWMIITAEDRRPRPD